jgi:bacteriocin-like protein
MKTLTKEELKNIRGGLMKKPPKDEEPNPPILGFTSLVINHLTLKHE